MKPQFLIHLFIIMGKILETALTPHPFVPNDEIASVDNGPIEPDPLTQRKTRIDYAR